MFENLVDRLKVKKFADPNTTWLLYVCRDTKTGLIAIFDAFEDFKSGDAHWDVTKYSKIKYEHVSNLPGDAKNYPSAMRGNIIDDYSWLQRRNQANTIFVESPSIWLIEKLIGSGATDT